MFNICIYTNHYVCAYHSITLLDSEEDRQTLVRNDDGNAEDERSRLAATIKGYEYTNTGTLIRVYIYIRNDCYIEFSQFFRLIVLLGVYHRNENTTGPQKTPLYVFRNNSFRFGHNVKSRGAKECNNTFGRQWAFLRAL